MLKPEIATTTGSWTETALWTLIKSKLGSGDEHVELLLRRLLPLIETVLTSGGTAPLDFTLHDAGHSFRVAQRMAQIVPADVLTAISTADLALLLLSAYLHDIGMTPARGRVTAHFLLLLSGGAQDTLMQRQVDEFQDWLDREGRGISPPLVKSGSPTNTTVMLAQELVTYYCREKHNDWSEEWIRANCSNQDWLGYSHWVEDLVALCKSHHWGYNELISGRFSPKLVGTQPEVVHLRYLACVLRLADVMEFDPERTPAILFRHRGISPRSVVYWWKDHHITLGLVGSRPEIDARPPNAEIHRAVELTCDQIDDELLLCRRIADETHFEKYPGPRPDLPHRWILDSRVYRNIQALDRSYEYIDASFRPDTDRLLELLSSTALYKRPFAAIREMLQNAFDAVREEVAYEYLSRGEHSIEELDTISQLQDVELRIETDTEDVWLICSDRGVGMSKAIIRDHLLVIGRGRRPDILALERACARAGFPLGRTGQFGVGVLSYFMIADRVVFRTRRSQLGGGTDANGWELVTDGVGSFGELREIPMSRHGTEVRLRLRKSILDKGASRWFSELLEELPNIVFRPPCLVRLGGGAASPVTKEVRSGWASAYDTFTHLILSRLRERRYVAKAGRPVSATLRNDTPEERTRWSQIREDLAKAVQWQLSDGELPGGLGYYQIHLPYFDLPGGKSLAFAAVERVGSELRVAGILDEFFWVPRNKFEMGWRGIRINASNERFQSSGPGIVEVDWMASTAGQVALDRSDVELSTEAETALEWLRGELQRIYERFVTENARSRYASLNRVIIGATPIPHKGDLKWLTSESDGNSFRHVWGRVNFPMVVYQADGAVLDGRQIAVLRSPGFDARGHRLLHPLFNVRESPPDRVLVGPSRSRLEFVCMWDRDPRRRRTSSLLKPAAAFGDSCRQLCRVQLKEMRFGSDEVWIWNQNNSLIQRLTPEAHAWVSERCSKTRNPTGWAEELLDDPARAASWVLQCIEHNEWRLWEAAAMQIPQFLKELWNSLFGTEDTEVYDYVQDHTNSELKVLSCRGWTIVDRSVPIRRRFADPGSAWLLKTLVDEEDHFFPDEDVDEESEAQWLHGRHPTVDDADGRSIEIVVDHEGTPADSN